MKEKYKHPNLSKHPNFLPWQGTSLVGKGSTGTGLVEEVFFYPKLLVSLWSKEHSEPMPEQEAETCKPEKERSS